MDTADPYVDDIVTWAEQQAAALRELARRPELSNAVDWANLIEEVETLGRSEWRGVASHIRNALIHMLKHWCDPDSLSHLVWARETRTALQEARDDYRASMRQLIDLDAVWARALDRAADDLRPYGVVVPPRIPERCPFRLDELLGPAFTHEAGVRRLYDLSTRERSPKT